MVVEKAVDAGITRQVDINHSLMTKLPRAVFGVVTQIYDAQRKIVLEPMPNTIHAERWNTLPIPVGGISILDNRETQDSKIQVMVGSIIATIVAMVVNVAKTYIH